MTDIPDLPILPPAREDSVPDLARAEELYQQMGMAETAAAARSIKGIVEAGDRVPWSTFSAYLAHCEKEATAIGTSTRGAFDMMETLLMNAIAVGGSPTRQRIISLAEGAPPVDEYVSPLEETLRHLVDEANAATRPWTLASLLMFAHVVRFDALERLIGAAVKHYGGSLTPEQRKDARTILLTLAFAKPLRNGRQPLPRTATPEEIAGATTRADSDLLRDAIAHGSFTLDTASEPPTVMFRHIDGPPIWEHPLPIADLVGLNNMLEQRLRFLEAFLRVLRGWGPHASTE